MSGPIAAYTKRSLYHGYIPATPEIHRKFLEYHFGPNAPKREDYSEPVKVFLEELTALGIQDKVKPVFEQALEQSRQYDKWADKKFEVKSYEDFLDKLSILVSEPPQFYKAKFGEHTVIGEPVGVPLFVLFDLIGNTSAGYILLTWKEFNVALKKMLNKWGDYLAHDPKSNSSLTKEQWFSAEGLNLLQSGLGQLTFEQTYHSDDDANPLYYKSWDSFFTRQLKASYVDPDGNAHPVRPIEPQPASGSPFYLYNPCESTAFRIAQNIQVHDTFWLKTQRYSLYEMLGGDAKPKLSKYAERLKGSSVLQSFLSPQDFHCWHSPIVGKVLESDVIDGTYFAVLPDEGAGEYDPDLLPGDPHGTMVRSQPWLSVSATRAVFIIEPFADANSPIDLVAFIPIGMVEVSTCEITYNKRNMPHNEDVKVGDELGRFHFGGSSMALVVKVKEGYDLVFQDSFDTPVRPCQHRWVHSVIGQIWKGN